MKDYLVKATVYNGSIRAYAASTTETVAETQRRQDTWATASAAIGRTVTITAMMGAMLKGDDTLTVKIEGNGPVGAIVADANTRGEVRGYVSNPHVDFELNDKGKLDVARAVGAGNLSIVKDLGMRDYFTGSVPIVSGEISEDFTYYFATSEQVPSAVGAGVLVNPDHSILAAGGFIVQVLPGASEEVIDKLEAHINELPPISKLVQEGYTPEQILERLFEGADIKFLETMPVVFKCKCSRERIENAIAGLGKEEIDAMIEEDGGADANCHFCNEHYHFTANELEQLKESK